MIFLCDDGDVVAGIVVITNLFASIQSPWRWAFTREQYDLQLFDKDSRSFCKHMVWILVGNEVSGPMQWEDGIYLSLQEQCDIYL